MTNTITTVRELMDHYIQNHPYGLKKNTIDCWCKPSMSKFEKWLTRPALIGDLNLKTVNGYIDWLRATASSSQMARSRRGPILLLVRYGNDLGIVPRFEGRIRKIRVIRDIPVGWRVDEVQKLLKLCLDPSYIIKKNLDATDNHWRTIQHNKLDTGPRLGLFIAGLISVAWDTTLRLSDSLSIRWDCLEFDSVGNARAQILMTKTGYYQPITISAETVKILRQIECDSLAKSDLILDWPYRREKLYDWVRAYVRDSGIRKGTMRRIRSGSSSEAERIERGAGRAALGHRSDWVAGAHYLDPAIVGVKDIIKPSLFREAEPTVQPATSNDLTPEEQAMLAMFRSRRQA